MTGCLCYCCRVRQAFVARELAAGRNPFTADGELKTQAKIKQPWQKAA